MKLEPYLDLTNAIALSTKTEEECILFVERLMGINLFLDQYNDLRTTIIGYFNHYDFYSFQSGRLFGEVTKDDLLVLGQMVIDFRNNIGKDDYPGWVDDSDILDEYVHLLKSFDYKEEDCLDTIKDDLDQVSNMLTTIANEYPFEDFGLKFSVEFL